MVQTPWTSHGKELDARTHPDADGFPLRSRFWRTRELNEEVATQVTGELDLHPTLRKTPVAIHACEAVCIATRDDGLERKIRQALKHGETGPTLRRKTRIIDFNDGVGGHVLGAGRSAFIEAGAGSVEAFDFINTPSNDIPIRPHDLTVGKELPDTPEVTRIDPLSVDIENVFDSTTLIRHTVHS